MRPKFADLAIFLHHQTTAATDELHFATIYSFRQSLPFQFNEFQFCDCGITYELYLTLIYSFIALLVYVLINVVDI